LQNSGNAHAAFPGVMRFTSETISETVLSTASADTSDLDLSCWCVRNVSHCSPEEIEAPLLGILCRAAVISACLP